MQLSDEETEQETADLDGFINDEPLDEGDVSFYRERNPLNINDYPKFNGQTINPIEAIYSDNELYFGEDEQPEVYAPEQRDQVTFDRFEGFEKSAQKFKKTLSNFENTDNELFDAVLYGLMFYKQENHQGQADVRPKKEDAQRVLGDKLNFDLLKIKSETLLDKTLFGFFERCYVINNVSSKNLIFSLKFLNDAMCTGF